MAQPIWNENSKHYTFLEKSNPKDLIEIEVGDAMDSSDFFPQVKLKRWQNEINFSMRLKHDNIPGNITYSDDGTTITWSKKQGQSEWKAVFYHSDDLEEGGFQFELYIPKKPPINYIEFTINTKELDYFYQPELTQEEIDEGAIRPENVVGSYAVYHKSKGGMNEASGMEYKVGKAFHLFRPQATDAVGSQTWVDMNIDINTGILRYTISQDYLNSAVYPIVIK